MIWKNIKKTIVFQVLNYGNEEAIRWLFKQYPLKVIIQTAQSVPLYEWNKKSLTLWRQMLNLTSQERFKSYANP